MNPQRALNLLQLPRPTLVRVAPPEGWDLLAPDEREAINHLTRRLVSARPQPAVVRSFDRRRRNMFLVGLHTAKLLILFQYL
jgi:hypothetical protein